MSLFNLLCPLTPHEGCCHLWRGESGLLSFVSPGSVAEQSVFSPFQFSRTGDCFALVEESWLCGTHVLVKIDSTIMVKHYLNRVGATRSRNLNWDIISFWDIIWWCLRSRITLTVVYILGTQNAMVHCLSHHQAKNPCQLERSTVWYLDSKVTSLLMGI